LLVNRINNLNNPTFGYDKKLNNKVKATLEKNYTPFNKTLLATNEFCNKLEDTIIEREKNLAPIYEIDNLVRMLASFKYVFAQMMEALFPKLNYVATEAEGYLNNTAVKKDNQDWRINIASCLYDIYEPTEENLEIKLLKQEFDEKYTKVMNIVQEELTGSMNPNSKKEEKSLISEFKPNEYSPKGFVSIGGMLDLLTDLKEKIIDPIKDPRQAQIDRLEYGKKFPKAILFYGPPGCGKTFITEALAIQADIPLFKFKVSELGSSYINKTSENYENAFKQVEEHAKKIGKPCFLFIDEIDGVTKNRDNSDHAEDLKQMSTLLNLIETARARNIIVIGATNKYDLMDEAIRQRFDGHFHIGLPDENTRKEVLEKALEERQKAQNLLSSSDDICAVAKAFEGFSNRTIVDITDKAAIKALKDNRRDITKQDFFDIIDESSDLKVEDPSFYKHKKTKEIGFKHEN